MRKRCVEKTKTNSIESTPLEYKEGENTVGLWVLVNGTLNSTQSKKKDRVSRIGWIVICDKEKCIVDDGKYQTTLYDYSLHYAS